jgi:hypothetical protein
MAKTKKKKNRATSPGVASEATRVPSDPNSSPKEQDVGGSPLSQAAPKKGKKGKK